MLNDHAHELALQESEQTFLNGSLEWFGAFCTAVEKVLEAGFPDVNQMVIRYAAALRSGEIVSVGLIPGTHPLVPETLRGLGRLCREHAQSKMLAYADLLRRHNIPASRAVRKLESRVAALLDETR